ncbi:hypothetical protein PFAG_03962 [Plasmodium falciparum Santa Lucia]|uniref:Uncharacterized protein n=2 Tax=Plasmodium falciparum TaxID=5833 RepID=A0A024W3V7_PLAFA|nr:hypothetical protein PFTANZ_03941 [Plasmodium falciparum Tanzania (2000708)]EUT82587.1 hypothetical protein PFAG_03962 [Plasmodium falciparum Santa Lucia]
MFIRNFVNIIGSQKSITKTIARNYFSDNSKLIIPRHGTTILCVRKNNEVVCIKKKK